MNNNISINSSNSSNSTNRNNKRLEAFENQIKGKKAAVIGIAVSNTPLIGFLAERGARVTAFDKSDTPELKARVAQIKAQGVEYRLGPGYLSGLQGFDWVIRTPVIRPDIPELAAERERGAIVTSEMELFLDLCPATVFGVTGSDGKTTTTTIIYEMLKAHGYNCHLGGNIGKPLLSSVGSMAPSDMVVVELSSFQLMTMKKSTNVAVITNLSPNHLDVHKSYDEYICAKKNIFTWQGPDDLCVLNYNNGETRAMGVEAPGRLGYFCGTGGAAMPGQPDKAGAFYGVTGGKGGADRIPDVAAYIRDGYIMYRDYHIPGGDSYCGGLDRVFRLEDIRLPGRHNIDNYLAAVCAVYPYISRSDAEAVAAGFNGVEHRIEYFRTVNGARYYNDSIATSPNRTIACLNSFEQRVILIAGGKDKNLDFKPLGPYLANKVKLLILCGQTSEKIKRSLLGFCQENNTPCTTPIIECENYEAAVAAAYENAKAKDTVVLSPSSTSFDCFKNFEERGRVFKCLVNALPGN